MPTDSKSRKDELLKKVTQRDLLNFCLARCELPQITDYDVRRASKIRILNDADFERLRATGKLKPIYPDEEEVGIINEILGDDADETDLSAFVNQISDPRQ